MRIIKEKKVGITDLFYYIRREHCLMLSVKMEDVHGLLISSQLVGQVKLVLIPEVKMNFDSSPENLFFLYNKLNC